MTSASMTFGRPGRITAPRGSQFFGQAAAALIGALRRLDRWELSRKASTAESVDQVLDWAGRIESVSPGLAADLRGAALRAQSKDVA
jgi:hypothetical protein